ncbi:hypothetical protein [Kibdelosporangium philippinense]
MGLYVQALITYVRELQAAEDQQQKPKFEAATDDVTPNLGLSRSI